jgi:hypothetical protein
MQGDYMVSRHFARGKIAAPIITEAFLCNVNREAGLLIVISLSTALSSLAGP